MKYSKNGLLLTEQFEGCRLKAYQDQGGVWTIGYGHTHGVTSSMTCSLEQAEAWLLEDVSWAERMVEKLVETGLTQEEFDALVDFAFNVGVGNLAGSTLLRKLNEGDLEGAAQEFHKWDRCKGVEVAGLLRRRLAEEAEFRQGMR